MPRTLLLCLLLIVPACATPPRISGLNPDRILHMAGEEAGQVTSPRERLGRQLNIADHELTYSQPAAARATLREARKTLEAAVTAAKPRADSFTNQARLAGWISISELSRRAEDIPFANEALDRAIADLHALNPLPERCEYVLGVANELRELRGDAPAAALITEGGGWAVDIASQPTRRQAYSAFAYQLFVCNAYDAGRDTLRRDEDPAWRSDTLMAIANQARGMESWSKSGSGGMALMRAAEAPRVDSGASINSARSASPTSFGKSLDFQTNYRDGK